MKLRDIYQQACDHLGFKETEFCGLAELIGKLFNFFTCEWCINRLCCIFVARIPIYMSMYWECVCVCMCVHAIANI